MTFTHLDAGTAEDAWRRAAPWSAGAPLTLDDVTHVFVTAAHPDDETLGAGGLMAQAAARGIAVTVIVATDGEASHPASPTVTRETLSAWRRAEIADALDRVAPASNRYFLGMPDGGLAERADLVTRLDEIVAAHVDPAGDAAPARTRAADDHATDADAPPGDAAAHGTVDDAATAEEAGRALIVSPWVEDRHPDHAAVARASQRVAEQRGLHGAAYPIWAWLWSDAAATDIPFTDSLVLALTPDDRQRKVDAMARHESQTRPLSDAPGDEAILSDAFQEHFRRDVEVFLPYPRVASPDGARATLASREVDFPHAEPDVTGSDDAESDNAESDNAEPDDAEPDAAEPDAAASEEIDSAATTPGASLGAEFFDEFYAGGRDPWGFETRWYEERKRAITMAALPAARYGRVLELGSSIGVTTALLAARADHVVATDIAEPALAVARERLAGASHVTFERLTLPAEWPEGTFDLVVVSEVGYYLSSAELDVLIDKILGSLTPDATVVTCHWRHPVAEYPLEGDAVTERFRERLRPTLDVTVTHTERDFVLDVHRTAPARSVAQETGLAE